MKQLKVISSLIIIVAMLMAAVPALAGQIAGTYDFKGICPVNDPNDQSEINIGEAQLHFSVSYVSGAPYPIDGIAFHFWNTGLSPAVIAEIYFQDGVLLNVNTAVAYWGTQTEVNFTIGNAKPPDLPCGNNVYPPFVPLGYFSADAGNNAPKWGVGPGEWVDIIFPLTADKLPTVQTQLDNGTIRVGLHVISIGTSGGSQSFINGGPTAITLSSFKTSCSRGSVAVNWTTATEVNNAGFNLYRSTNVDGARIQLNSKLLAAKGDTISGASYSFNDASGYGTYYYWLEDVSLSGTTTLHGPTLTAVTPPFRSPLYRPALPSR